MVVTYTNESTTVQKTIYSTICYVCADPTPTTNKRSWAAIINHLKSLAFSRGSQTATALVIILRCFRLFFPSVFRKLYYSRLYVYTSYSFVHIQPTKIQHKNGHYCWTAREILIFRKEKKKQCTHKTLIAAYVFHLFLV